MSIFRRHIRRKAGLQTFGTFVIAVATVFAAGSSALAAPVLRLTAATGNSGIPGTVSGSGGQAQRAATLHSSQAAPQDATGDLSTVLSTTVNGGYTAAGIGMRNLGYGTISITGVPSGATVKSATLIWDVLASGADPALAQGAINGTAITGTAWATGASPCWPVGNNFSYEADVTSLVTGNGSYNLSGFASGQSDGADPWNVGSTPPLLEGATLIVIYQSASMPSVTVQIAEGATETDSGNSATATMSGFTVGQSPTASTTYIVADGQESGNTAAFDGTTLAGVSFPGAAPQAAPNYSMGNLWDTVTADVSSLLTPGDTSASLAVTGDGDCLVWVGQVLSVPAGPVLGLGDSVAAGYGLGPSQGNPDNPSAYPLILGKDLGVSASDYAIEGACSVSNANCPSSVAQEITQVPSSFKPSLITLTVGADDINFGGCLKSILASADLSMTSPSDPCNATTLTASLAALRQNLTSDLSTLATNYPGVPIEVMDYYNPFPPATTATPCAISKGVDLIYQHARLHTWFNVAKLYLFSPKQFTKDAQNVQAQLYADGQSVVSALNSTINAAAAAGNAQVISTANFAGHDMCSSSQWVFEPTISASLMLRMGKHQTSSSFSSGGAVCPDPVAASDWNKKVSKSFGINLLGISGSFSFSMGVNCAPHPNAAGQEAIAGDFAQQGKQ